MQASQHHVKFLRVWTKWDNILSVKYPQTTNALHKIKASMYMQDTWHYNKTHLKYSKLIEQRMDLDMNLEKMCFSALTGLQSKQKRKMVAKFQEANKCHMTCWNTGTPTGSHNIHKWHNVHNILNQIQKGHYVS